MIADQRYFITNTTVTGGRTPAHVPYDTQTSPWHTIYDGTRTCMLDSVAATAWHSTARHGRALLAGLQGPTYTI